MSEAPATIEGLLALQAATDTDRWRVTSDAAQVAACYLACHPRVEAVRYPGLKSDPDFARAACELRGGFGPLVWYRVAGEAGWRRFEAEPGDAREQVMALEAKLLRNLQR